MPKKTQQEELNHIASEFLFQQAFSQFLLMLNEVADDLLTTSTTEQKPEIPELALAPIWENLRQKRNALFFALPDLLAKDENAPIHLPETFQSLMNEVLDAYEKEQGARLRLRVCTDTLADDIFLETTRQEKRLYPISHEAFLKDCTHFLQEDWNNPAHAGQLLYTVPLRLARERAMDLLRKGMRSRIEGASREEATANLRLFHLLLAPAPRQEDEALLSAQEAAALTQLSLEEKEALSETMEHLEEIFSAASEIGAQLFLHAKTMHVLGTLPFTLEDFWDDNPICRDLYFALKEQYEAKSNPEELEVWLEDFLVRTEPVIEAKLDEISTLTAQWKKTEKKVSLNPRITPQEERILQTTNSILAVLTGGIEPAVFSFHGEESDILGGDTEVAEAEASLRSYLTRLSAANRRSAIRLLLSTVAMPWGSEDVLQIISDTFTDLPDLAQHWLMLHKAGSILSDYGFDHGPDGEGQTCDCGHDHGHGHDCGCGHDHGHHHGHDCGCGHDHGHGHDCDCHH